MATNMTAVQAKRIVLRDFSSPPMRAFHMTWSAFFLTFFGWFGVAPLMAVVRDDLALTKEQVGDVMIAAVAATILARLVVGWLLDKLGPRRTYAWLLVLGAFPVMGLGLAHSYLSFLVLRLAIGAVGASFVITQYHMSVMFAPNVVGAANATTAGWGNLGGGVTQLVMPLVFAGLVALGFQDSQAWRLAMVVPGLAMIVWGLAYGRLTQDSPSGDYRALRESGQLAPAAPGAFRKALGDHRTWLLLVAYGACFGVELTMNNVAALYFHDRFGLSLTVAGAVAFAFGGLNLFARALGGLLSDKIAVAHGLRGRSKLLGACLLGEGLALVLFARMGDVGLAIAAMMLFGMFVQLAEGATFAVVPFVNRKALGPVTGLVGAGGNLGAVAAGFLFRSAELPWADAFLWVGVAVAAASLCGFAVRFPAEVEYDERRALDEAMAADGDLALRAAD